MVMSHLSLRRGGCRSKLQPSRKNRGFSLVELMIGLVLLALLSVVGIPLYQDFIAGQRLRAITADLRVALVTARSEAVKRNRAITLLPNAGGWNDGWRILDPDDPVANPPILRQKQPGNITITGPAQVRYTPSGRPLLAPMSFEIDVGGSDNAIACMRLQLDGRTDSVPEPCP